METLFGLLALLALASAAFGGAALALVAVRHSCSPTCDREGAIGCALCPRRREGRGAKRSGPEGPAHEAGGEEER